VMIRDLKHRVRTGSNFERYMILRMSCLIFVDVIRRPPSVEIVRKAVSPSSVVRSICRTISSPFRGLIDRKPSNHELEFRVRKFVLFF